MPLNYLGSLFYSADGTFLYLVLVLPAIVFSMFCQMKVSSTFKKYSSVRTKRAITGQFAAQEVCKLAEARDVRVEGISGNLTDHFDPKANVIRLSESVYGQASVAAVGVAAHEAGHATQYAHGYGPIRVRNAIIPVSRFGSTLAMPLVIAGIVLNYTFLINIGIFAFGLVFLFQVVTLPVEFNASARALQVLKSGNLLDDEEILQAKKVLSAAAMTYVAAMAVSLAQLLRLLLLSRNRGRR